MRFLMPAIAATLLLAAAPTPSTARENRCGWIQLPTPGNAWLDDRDGTWVLQTQGERREPEGMDRLPDFSEGEFVRTNGYYGYACTCMQVDVEEGSEAMEDAAGEVTRIYSVRQLPLSKCRADPDLPDPD